MTRMMSVCVSFLPVFAGAMRAESLPSRSAASGAVVLNVRQFGATGDGVTLDMAALQAAIDACAGAGGGTVLVPGGRYLTGTLFLRSRVTVRLEPAAVLLGSTDLRHYASSVERCGFETETALDKCLLYAENAEQVALTGRGTVDGQGAAFPVRLADGRLGERPMLIRFYRCRDVLVDGVTLRSAGSWCTHLRECSHVRVHGVTIHNRVNGNNDGIDLMSTDHARISDCTLICGDDAICFQSMSDDRPVQDVVITNCIMSTRWAAIRSGGAHRGGIRRVAVSNCVIRDTYGCGIKLQISGNGTMEDMVFSNIVMTEVTSPISLRFGNCHYNNEKRDERHPFGTMRNIVFTGIRASVIDEAVLDKVLPEHHPGEERQCISICGIPGHPVESVTLSDIHVTFPGGGTKADAAKREMPELEDQYPEYFMWGVLPAYGLYARHARALVMNNVRFELAKRDLRPAVVCDDVEDLEVSGLRCMGDRDAESMLRLGDTRDAFIRGCRPLSDIGDFVRLEGKGTHRITFDGNDLSRAKRVVSAERGADPQAATFLSGKP